jgi:glycosyltransferase involved in cell wall biosynthesis
MSLEEEKLPWVLIPAYQPDQRLTEFVEILVQQKAFAKIIVVDDGSSQDRAGIFDTLKCSFNEVIVLQHAVNRGKGQALKTGLNYYLLKAPASSPGIVSCDADGQHLAKDVVNVAQKGTEKASFTLGVRVFGSNTPFRSKLGNTITSVLFGLFTGYRLGDTQTGLRFFPRHFVGFFLKIPYDRFEYEFASLVSLTHEYPGSIQQVPIETVYLDGNSSSHYRAIKDSFTIGTIFFKFFFLSISTTIIDYAVFTLAYLQFKHILLAFISARTVSIIYNFTLSRNFIFKVKTNLAKQLAKYIGLVVILMCVSWGITEFIAHIFGGYVVLAKALAESGLFFLSWLVQRRFVFKPKRKFEGIS